MGSLAIAATLAAMMIAILYATAGGGRSGEVPLLPQWPSGFLGETGTIRWVAETLSLPGTGTSLSQCGSAGGQANSPAPKMRVTRRKGSVVELQI